MNDTVSKDGVTPAEVASYLRRHPAFLHDYPDLALTLLPPREEGKTTSLASYQLDVLRDKNRDLGRRLTELVSIANENEQLMQRVHALNLSLMREATLAGSVRRVVAGLREDFSTDFVRLVLLRADPELPAADWLIVQPQGMPALPEFAEFFRNGEALCGRLHAEKLDFLFGKHADEVHSSALVALGERDAPLGLLAIGSADANRFHPGMGTIFLKLIAETVSAAIARFPAHG
ncbi:MAG: DUF484 family protein [Proteobacteria bacterium]|uniref:DUF484 family protein n=1 Tax=Rudaea sp. TaxID=2136325 RepID=UPI0037852FBA|nr:DUF484 family protein [Pseudomonadota bacterium]